MSLDEWNFDFGLAQLGAFLMVDNQVICLQKITKSGFFGAKVDVELVENLCGDGFSYEDLRSCSTGKILYFPNSFSHPRTDIKPACIPWHLFRISYTGSNHSHLHRFVCPYGPPWSIWKTLWDFEFVAKSWFVRLSLQNLRCTTFTKEAWRFGLCSLRRGEIQFENLVRHCWIEIPSTKLQPNNDRPFRWNWCSQKRIER